MVAKLTLELQAGQFEELDKIRRLHPKPYVRERAAALIKVSQGKSARWVALEGLLFPRDPETVATWVHDFKERAFESLIHEPGRGRKPASPP